MAIALDTDSLQRREAIQAAEQIVLQLRPALRPAAAEVPHIGTGGVIDTTLAQPGKGGVEGFGGGDLADVDRSRTPSGSVRYGLLEA